MVKTIKIKKYTLDSLKELKNDGESYDVLVNRLLDEYADVLSVKDNFPVGHSSMDLSDDTLERLIGCRVYENEPYDNVLFRLLLLLG